MAEGQDPAMVGRTVGAPGTREGARRSSVAWLRAHKWTLLSIVLLLFVGVLVAFSDSFNACMQENQRQQSVQSFYDIVHSIVRVRWWCTGVWIDQNSVSMMAVATIAVAWLAFTLKQSSALLWKSNARTLENTERAFIVIKGFNRELATRADYLRSGSPNITVARGDELTVARFAVQPIWENAGRTPTRNLRVRVDWMLEGHRPGEVGTYQSEFTRIFIAPQSAETTEFIEMPGLHALVQDGRAGTLSPVPRMLIWGEATYEDIFGNAHFLRWCYRVRAESHAGGPLRVSFIQSADYNYTDEDEERSSRG